MPERVGRYDLLLPIASGGMATVYLARSQGVGGFERLVALKLTHAHLREHEDFSGGLVDEAKLAARIRHPNVVPVLDVGDDPNGVFLVMEYVEGDSLAGLRRRAAAAGEGLPQAVVLSILLDALAGLHSAHELKGGNGERVGLVHRDFSPQNILVGVNGIAWLTDFGVAKAATRLTNTATGLIKGKLSYMSPEQARGEALDRRCDVWAAGVVAWEALAGRSLYKSENDVATLLKIATQEPPRLGTVVPGFSPELDHAVAWALTMDLPQRCPTAADLARSLRKAAPAADREEVAEWVTRLTESKLAERHARIREIGDLRAKMGEIASASVESASGSSTSGRLGAAQVAATDTDAKDGTATELAVQTAETRRLGPIPAQAPFPPRIAEVDQTGTDTTSVTSRQAAQSVADLSRGQDSLRGRSIAVGVATGAVLAMLVGALVLVSRAGRVDTAMRGAFQPIPATVLAAAQPAVVAQPVPSPVAGGRSLSLRANAPIASLRVEGRLIALDSPKDAVEIPVGASQTELRIDARSSDGRVFSTRVPPGGSTVVEITFPRSSGSRTPVVKSRKGDTKPRLPFPDSPFGK